jgi:hypothetical protein
MTSGTDDPRQALINAQDVLSHQPDDHVDEADAEPDQA